MRRAVIHASCKTVHIGNNWTAGADAIRDASGRGDVVLDLFGGSGSTLIAAEKTGRRGFMCELDAINCDRILARWEAYAKDDAEQLICGWSAPSALLKAAE